MFLCVFFCRSARKKLVIELINERTRERRQMMVEIGETEQVLTFGEMANDHMAMIYARASDGSEPMATKERATANAEEESVYFDERDVDGA